MTTTKKPLSREELLEKLEEIPIYKQVDFIEANTRLEQEKLVDAQMAEISRLQVYAEKRDREIATLRELVKEAYDGWKDCIYAGKQYVEWLAKAEKLLENGHNDR